MQIAFALGSRKHCCSFEGDQYQTFELPYEKNLAGLKNLVLVEESMKTQQILKQNCPYQTNTVSFLQKNSLRTEIHCVERTNIGQKTEISSKIIKNFFLKATVIYIKFAAKQFSINLKLMYNQNYRSIKRKLNIVGRLPDNSRKIDS